MKSDAKIFITKQRQVILEELKKTASHPTADEVFLMVRQRLPRISLGTVYRNLELLSENGTIQKSLTGRAGKNGMMENLKIITTFVVLTVAA